MTTSSRPKWAKKLTASQWRHLVEDACDGRPTLAAVRRTVEWQREQDAVAPEGARPCCWECHEIARVLGL